VVPITLLLLFKYLCTNESYKWSVNDQRLIGFTYLQCGRQTILVEIWFLQTIYGNYHSRRICELTVLIPF